MYLSHPVRRIRDDPEEGETVALVVELAPDADPSALVDFVDGVGGTVEKLRFSHRVMLPEVAVSDLCGRSNVERIETADTLGLGIDSGVDDFDSGDGAGR